MAYQRAYKRQQMEDLRALSPTYREQERVRQAERNRRPEVKAYQRAAMARWRAKPENKARQREYERRYQSGEYGE